MAALLVKLTAAGTSDGDRKETAQQVADLVKEAGITILKVMVTGSLILLEQCWMALQVVGIGRSVWMSAPWALRTKAVQAGSGTLVCEARTCFLHGSLVRTLIVVYAIYRQPVSSRG